MSASGAVPNGCRARVDSTRPGRSAGGFGLRQSRVRWRRLRGTAKTTSVGRHLRRLSLRAAGCVFSAHSNVIHSFGLLTIV
jgi:hypothetical protein